jgi:hypothetical protein
LQEWLPLGVAQRWNRRRCDQRCDSWPCHLSLSLSEGGGLHGARAFDRIAFFGDQRRAHRDHHLPRRSAPNRTTIEIAREFILWPKRADQTCRRPHSTATTGQPKLRTAGIRRTTDCRRDRHRSGDRPATGPGHDAVDLATLFRGGDDLLIADSEPGVIPANVAPRPACCPRAPTPAAISNSSCSSPCNSQNLPCNTQKLSLQHPKALPAP